jgi:hypothetical protein
MGTLSTGAWYPILAAEQAAVAQQVARRVSARLQTPAQIEGALRASQQQFPSTSPIQWLPYALAQGWAGLAVMCGYLTACFPDEDWDLYGRTYLTLAARGAEGTRVRPPGLWAGLSGLAFAAWYLSAKGFHYRNLRTALAAALVPQATAVARHVAAQQQGVAIHAYDLISGLAGIGAWLLTDIADPVAAAALQTVIAALITLIGDEARLPRWHSPAATLDAHMRERYPGGNFNCGLAHGVPGPLALLALAQRAGVAAPGLSAAIERVADWLVGHQLADAYGVTWPVAVALDPAAPPSPPSRTAWCYGSPGVARALWLAGAALDHPPYQDLAVAAMEAVYRRPVPARRIDSPTFCHGVAGLLQITLRFAHDTDLALFRAAAQTLTTQLLDQYEPDSLLGYRSIERAGARVDHPGLLDGAPGVALVLLAATMDVDPTWDRLFLLA